MRFSRTMKALSIALVLALLLQLLPVQVFAAEAAARTQDELANEGIWETTETAESAYIVEEIISKRSECGKEYLLSNGLHMAAVYPEPVHYEKDGGWEDIDNTLKAIGTGTSAAYTNG